MRVRVGYIEKLGVPLSVFVDLDDKTFQLYLTNGTIEVPVLKIEKRSGCDTYLIRSGDAEKLFGRPFPKKYVSLRSEDAGAVEEKARQLWLDHKGELEEETADRSTKVKMWFSPIHTYVQCDDEKISAPYLRETAELIRTCLEEWHISNLLKRQANDVVLREAGLSWYYEMTYGEYQALVELAKRRKREREERAKSEGEEFREKHRSSFELAKELGEPVVIAYYVEACNDPNRACDLDTVTKYAMPDGSVKVLRNHTG